MTSLRTCQQCGKPLRDEDRFCSHCGTGQTDIAAAPAAVAGSPWEAILERLGRATAPRYRILRLLGYGGMAGVYLAEEPRLGRRVAIKVMSPALMMDAGLIGRFEQEARTTAQINHPNIVTIFDVDEREGLHYFVMAYVPGRTLAQVLAGRGGPLPVPVLGHWLNQAGGALAYAHRAGIVHRDIKPANVLLDAEGNALVTDFGIAKVADEPSLTRTGILVGTPPYMSPEQCISGAVTGASDQYSLGIVAYEMVTGAPPFTGGTMAVLHAQVNEQPRPIGELRPDCPAHLADAVHRMLAKKPENRFPNIGAALAATGIQPIGHDDPVRDSLAGLGAAVESITLAPPPAPITVGATVALDAAPVGAGGRKLAARRLSWRSDSPSVAEVTDAGVVFAVAAGETRIRVSCEGVSAAVPVSVQAMPSAVELVTDRMEIPAGEVLPLRARVHESGGSAPLVWTSSDPDIAAVTEDGRVCALRPGTVTITASTGSHSASAVLSITRPDLESTSVETETVTGEEWKQPFLTPAPSAEGPITGATSLFESGERKVGVTPPVTTSGPLTPVSAATDPFGGPAAPLSRGPTSSVADDARAPALATAAGQPGKRSRMPWIAGAGAIAVVAAVAVFWPRGAAEPTAGGTQPIAEVGGNPGDAAAASPTGQPIPPVPSPPALDTALASVPDITSARTATDRAAAAAAQPDEKPPAAAPAPRVGTLRLGPALPADAAVRVVDGNGRIRTVTNGSASLPAGRYRIEASADGYEAASGTVTIVAGETATWNPTLTAEADNAPEAASAAAGNGRTDSGYATPPVAPDAAAERIRGTLAGFVKAWESRKLDQVVGLYPSASSEWKNQWRPVIEDTRNVQDLTTTLGTVGTPDIEGDRATVEFSMSLSYNDYRNKHQQPSFRFQATLTRAGDRWVLSELQQRR